jgi:hypothetical protein
MAAAFEIEVPGRIFEPRRVEDEVNLITTVILYS